MDNFSRYSVSLFLYTNSNVLDFLRNFATSLYESNTFVFRLVTHLENIVYASEHFNPSHLYEITDNRYQTFKLNSDYIYRPAVPLCGTIYICQSTLIKLVTPTNAYTTSRLTPNHFEVTRLHVSYLILLMKLFCNHDFSINDLTPDFATIEYLEFYSLTNKFFEIALKLLMLPPPPEINFTSHMNFSRNFDPRNPDQSAAESILLLHTTSCIPSLPYKYNLLGNQPAKSKLLSFKPLAFINDNSPQNHPSTYELLFSAQYELRCDDVYFLNSICQDLSSQSRPSLPLELIQQVQSETISQLLKRTCDCATTRRLSQPLTDRAIVFMPLRVKSKAKNNNIFIIDIIANILLKGHATLHPSTDYFSDSIRIPVRQHHVHNASHLIAEPLSADQKSLILSLLDLNSLDTQFSDVSQFHNLVNALNETGTCASNSSPWRESSPPMPRMRQSAPHDH